MFIENLYSEYYDYLFRFACSLCRDSELAQELVQETFLRAVKNKELLMGLKPYMVKAWLFRVSKNYFIDVKRKEKKYTLYDEDFSFAVEIDYNSNLNFEEMLNVLNEEEKELIIYKYVYKMNSKEIALKKDIPDGTVRYKLHNAIKKLREKYL